MIDRRGFVGLLAALPFSSAAAQEAPGFRPLFNGRDMEGFQFVGAPASTWKVADGVIVCAGRPNGYFVTARPYHNYVLRFGKNELPPVDAFWSVTMYDAEGFQVANPINRFAIGDRDALKFNEDGSLNLYIQHESPGADKESNWLPSPKTGKLGVTMRLYAPKAEVVDGLWVPPPVRKASTAAVGGSTGEEGRE